MFFRNLFLIMAVTTGSLWGSPNLFNAATQLQCDQIGKVIAPWRMQDVKGQVRLEKPWSECGRFVHHSPGSARHS